MLCLTAGVLGITYIKLKTIVFFGDYLLKIALGIAIILFILLLNTKISIGNKVSGFLGNISYEVYLLHHTVFGFIAAFEPTLISGFFIALSIVITVISSIIVHIFSKLLEEMIKRRIQHV